MAQGDRPPPRISSLAGAAAGLLLLSSLGLFLTEITGDQQRLGGVAVSLLFEGIGVALLLLNRDQRTATAGVALTAIGIVPLLIYLFVDVRNPDRTINDVSSFTSTTTLILLIAASLWLVAYFAGPGRRYGFYLGAALLALWLVAVVQIVDSPLNQVFDGFSTSSSFTPVDPGFDGTTTDEFGTGDEFN